MYVTDTVDEALVKEFHYSLVTAKRGSGLSWGGLREGVDGGAEMKFMSFCPQEGLLELQRCLQPQTSSHVCREECGSREHLADEGYNSNGEDPKE